MKYNIFFELSFLLVNCEFESERSLRFDFGYVTEKVQQKLDFILKLYIVEVKAGGIVIFLCRIIGFFSLSIKWEINGKIINNDERYKVKCILFFFEIFYFDRLFIFFNFIMYFRILNFLVCLLFYYIFVYWFVIQNVVQLYICIFLDYIWRRVCFGNTKRDF